MFISPTLHEQSEIFVKEIRKQEKRVFLVAFLLWTLGVIKHLTHHEKEPDIKILTAAGKWKSFLNLPFFKRCVRKKN